MQNIKEKIKKVYNKIKGIIRGIIEMSIILFQYNRNAKDSRDKNIMILVSKLSNGGAERVAANLAEELKKKYLVILVTYLPREEKEYECKVKRIEIETKEEVVFKDYHRIKRLKRIKQKYNITHTISFCTKANFLNVMSRNGDKTIISIRNYMSKTKEGINKKIYNRVACKLCDKIVAVSELVKQDEIKNFGAKKEKIEVIYNYCDVDKINKILDSDNKIEELKNKKYIINIGRLEYQKAQSSLIKAFSLVKEQNSDLNLVILGIGKEEKKLKELVKELKLEKSVHIIGYKSNPYKYLKNAEIFILNSRHEGMSNALLEAMACDLPIISTDCKAGTREILAPNTDLNKATDEIEETQYGILVPIPKKEENEITKQERILAEAINKMINEDDLNKYYKNQSKKRIQDFAKEPIIEKWIKLIEEKV